MKLARLALLVVAATISSAGCRTAGLGNLSTANPIIPSRTTWNASEVLAAHNRNAEHVQSFEAKPSIGVSIDNRENYRVDGNLAMERPRNFKLRLKSHMMGEVADIGSNDDEFWFWTRQFDKKGPKAIYFCKYDDASSNSLAATLQPDWVVEALGLRVIPQNELAEIRVKRGREPGTLLLTQQASTGDGVSFVREMVVWESNHRIKELRIYTSDRRLLAQAVVVGGPSSYQEIPGGPGVDGSTETVYVPARLKLDWFQERLTLDVTLSSPKANPGFTDARRQALFVEPERKGYDRINLAELAAAQRGPTTVRETRPAPAPRVRLREPAPFGTDDARRTSRDPVALSADLPDLSRGSEEVVGPAIPSAPDPDFVKAGASTWRSSRMPPAYLER